MSVIITDHAFQRFKERFTEKSLNKPLSFKEGKKKLKNFFNQGDDNYPEIFIPTVGTNIGGKKKARVYFSENSAIVFIYKLIGDKKVVVTCLDPNCEQCGKTFCKHRKY